MDSPIGRVEANYLFQPTEDEILHISSPVYSIQEGMEEYNYYCGKQCIDNPNKPCQVEFWLYSTNFDKGITIAKNY